MMPIKKLQSGLSPEKDLYTSDDFFHLHRHVEAYIKRVFLIGLRLNSIRYEPSRQIVDHGFIPIREMLAKSVVMLDPARRSARTVTRDLKLRHADFFVLKGLFLDFSSHFRNRFAHGTVGEFRSHDLVRCLCHVDRSFYEAFEQLLGVEYGRSAFDKPGEWGAKKGLAEDIEISIARLGLNTRIRGKPMKVEDVESKLIATNFPFER